MKAGRDPIGGGQEAARDALDEGRPEDALRALEGLREEPEVLALRGLALVDLGREEEGLPLLERACRSRSAPGWACLELGWLLLDRAGDPRRAAAEGERALCDPDEEVRAGAHALRFECAVEELAEDGLARVRRLGELASLAEGALGTEDPLARLCRGRAWFYAGKFAEAAEALGAAEPGDPSGLAAATLGAALERLGDLPRADRLLRRAAELDPARPVPCRTDEREFDRVLEQALAGLPGPVREAVGRHCIVAREDFPAAARVREEGVDPLLLGECIGTAEDARQGLSGPARVLVYRRNLEKVCADLEELREETRITLLHEVGHALGFDEDGVDELGLA